MGPAFPGSVRERRAPRRGGLFASGYEVDPRGRRVPSTAAEFPGRRLVQTAAVVDLVFAAAVLAETLFFRSPWGRFIARFLVALAAWVVLAFQTGATAPRALEIRRALGVIGVGFVLFHRIVSGPATPADAPWLGAACLVLGFGALATHRALSLRAAEVCEAHPRWESCAPDPAAWSRRRLVVAVCAAEWVAAGAVETWFASFWFGLVIAAGGVLGLILSKDLSRPADEHRLRAVDRSTHRSWLVYPLAAPLLVVRVLWVLRRLV